MVPRKVTKYIFFGSATLFFLEVLLFGQVKDWLATHFPCEDGNYITNGSTTLMNCSGMNQTGVNILAVSISVILLLIVVSGIYLALVWLKNNKRRS